jgi:diguanylate cyclase
MGQLLESPDRWQQPYREAVEELDRREREWRQTDELLRRIAGRLCIAARGLDDALDDSLNAVISTLRKPAEPAPLESLLDALTRSVAALDHASTAAVAKVIDGDRLRKTLHRLLDQLSALPRAEALRAELETAERDEAIAEVAVGIADLSQAQASALQRAKLESDRLLMQFSERLEEIARHLKCESEEQRGAQNEQRAFGQQLLDETQALISQTREATDLTSLQDQVYRRLTTIDQRVRDHRSREETRALAYKERTEALYERIETLENQTRVLTRSVSKLERQVGTDTLTRVANRAAYDKRIAAELAQHKRDGKPRSLAAIDIDHFKRINDRYGHQAGDKVLQVLAQHWSRYLRETDFFGRYGGEEFVMLLDNSNEQQALLITNKLRQSVEKLGFHFRQQPVAITVSCGLTGFRADDTPQTLFERADKALYEAKRNGRNRCCIEA